MTSYDRNGRLRITMTSTGSGGGGGSLTVRASGTLGSVSASSVSTLTFSGSFLTASNATSGEVIVSYFNNPPIMYLSGFRSSATPANVNIYLVTSSGFFSGSERFMCSVLYSNPWPIASPDNTCLAGCATTPAAVAGDWKLWSIGSEVFDDDQASFSVSAQEGLLAPGLSAFGKWHLVYGFYSVDEVNQGYMNLDSAGEPYPFSVIGTPTWTTATSFSIGGFGNGLTYEGGGPTRIAAVALATASYVVDKETLFRYFQQVYRDGDIRQNGLMNWDHIWSVKQNSPGAVWRDAVGSMHLNRSGTLIIGTESNPRWP